MGSELDGCCEEGRGGPDAGAAVVGWAEVEVAPPPAAAAEGPPAAATLAGASYCLVACTPSRSGMDDS